MTCPHSTHGSPSSCSQCLRTPARRVDLVDGQILVDGIEARANDEPVSVQMESARRRGSNAKRRK